MTSTIGLTSKDFDKFIDLLIKANDIQIAFMIKELKNEQVKRKDRVK